MIRRTWALILCVQLVFTSFHAAHAQISNGNNAFLEYLDKSQSPSDFIIKRFPNQKLIQARLISGVAKPGYYQIPENTSLLTLLSYSGGANADSDLRSVTIWREPTKETFKYNVEDLLADPKAKDPVIMPYDVVHIPTKEKIISNDTLTVILVISTVAATILSAIAIHDRFDKPNGP